VKSNDIRSAHGVEQFHNTAQHAQDIKALEEIAKGGTQPQAAKRIIRDIPAGVRKTRLQAIQRKVRDARFRISFLWTTASRLDSKAPILTAVYLLGTSRRSAVAIDGLRWNRSARSLNSV
jgi:hypothetical protein